MQGFPDHVELSLLRQWYRSIFSLIQEVIVKPAVSITLLAIFSKYLFWDGVLAKVYGKACSEECERHILEVKLLSGVCG